MNKHHNPKVSVIVPAYNAEQWIEETLISIQLQTIINIEIIVVDDGSNDQTSAIVNRYLNSDPRIRLLSQENQGVGAARNLGLNASSGEFIAPVDADDLWHPKKLELQLEKLEKAGDHVGLVYSHFSNIDEIGIKTGDSATVDIEGNVLFSIILTNFIGNGSVPLVRASVLREVGPFLTRIDQEDGEGCEDWEMYIRISEKYNFELVPQDLVSYRQIHNSMSSSTNSMIKSYRTLINRSKQRNPNFPCNVYRKSEHIFYVYLITKLFQNFRYRDCLISILRLSTKSRRLLYDRRVLVIFIKSIMRIASRSIYGICDYRMNFTQSLNRIQSTYEDSPPIDKTNIFH
jgi:glycosyltransferase involved in cell wall biosynthesis